MANTPADPHPKSAELAYADSATLAAAFAAKELTSEELTEALISRIEAIDQAGPSLRAVLALAPDALEVARERDQERADGRLRGPLHGMPVLIKDNIETVGLASGAGSLALSAPPSKDALIVASLREAGAVVVGKTNLSEWANFRSTKSSSGWSAVGGQTRNPYALERSPSGSSSGAGAGCAAGLAPLSVGTETDGSIMSPAAVAGLVGLKPTIGLVSRTGVIPISPSQDTAGPMARTVADAARLLGALVAADPSDPAFASRPGGDGIPADYAPFCRPDGLAGARIGVPREGFTGYHPAADALFDEALEAMREAGAILVDPVAVPGQKELSSSEDELELLCYEFHDSLDRYLSARAERGGGGPRTLDELIAFNLAHKEEELSLFGQEIFERAAKTGSLDDPAYQKARAKCRELSRTNGLDPAFEDHSLDAIAALTTAPAWLIDHINGDHYLGSGYSIAAIAGYPAITVPIGTVHRLPVGCAFLGRPFAEGRLISLAAGLEAQLSLALRPGFEELGLLG